MKTWGEVERPRLGAGISIFKSWPLSLKDRSPSKLLNPPNLSFLIYEMGLIIFISQGCGRSEWNGLCDGVTAVPEVPQMLLDSVILGKDTRKSKITIFQLTGCPHRWRTGFRGRTKWNIQVPCVAVGPSARKLISLNHRVCIWTKRWKHLPGKGVQTGTMNAHVVLEQRPAERIHAMNNAYQ